MYSAESLVLVETPVVETAHKSPWVHPGVGFDFGFSLSIPQPVLTTSTYAAAWPQGDQFLGGGM